MLLRTLGGLELAASSFSRPKPLLVLAYLALEGPKERRHLVELFWPRAANPSNQLAVTLARLRRAGDALVAADATRVRAGVESDARQLLAAVEDQAYPLATRLYRGPFLDGVHLDEWPAELEEWVYATRDVLALQATTARLALAEAEAAAGRFRDAARGAEEAYRTSSTAGLEPHDLRRIHTLLLAADSPHTVRVRQEAEPFGIPLLDDPTAAREALARSPGGDAGVPHNLPAPGRALVGRDPELVELAARLRDPAVRLLSIVGAGGMGKSHLALEAARQQLRAAMFEDGVYVVFLDAVTESASLPGKLAETLGVALRGGREPFAQLQRVVGGRSMLWVLDNLEHLLDVAPGLAELLRGCPRLKLLTTSRVRLNLSEEWYVPLDGLSFARESVPLARLVAYDAVTLFVRRARQARPDFTLTEGNAEAVRDICRRLDGSPLGLELAASWVRSLSCEEIAEELGRDLDFLSSGARDVPDRHRSLRAAFEHSWRLATPNERSVLARLSVFQGGFTRDAATEVADATIPVVASLVDRSLLRFDPQGRYDRHPLIHQYTQEKLAERPAEAARAHARHAAYFGALVQRLEHEYDGPTPGRAYARLEAELENVRVAWRWAVRCGSAPTFDACAPAFGIHFFDRWAGDEPIELWSSALAALDETDPTHRVTVGGLLGRLAFEYVERGRLEEASALAERGLALLRPLHPRSDGTRGMFDLLLVLAMVAQLRGRFREAIGHIRTQAELGLIDIDGRHLNNLGLLEREAGNYPAAKAHLRQALRRSRQEGNLRQLVKALDLLGDAHFHGGELEEARRLYRETVALVRRDGPFGASDDFALLHLGRAALALGDVDEADRVANALLDRHDDRDKFHALARVLQADIAVARGDHERAEDRLRRAFLSTVGHLGPLGEAQVQDVSHVLLSLGELRLRQGRHGDAAGIAGFLRPHLHVVSERDRLECLVADLRAVMPLQALEASSRAGAGRALDELANELVPVA